MKNRMEIQYRSRAFKALLISMCLHLIIIMVLAFTLYSQRAGKIQEELPIAFVDSKHLRPLRPNILNPFKIKPLDVSERRMEEKEVTEESSNKFDEVLKQAPFEITRSATVERHFEKTDVLPEVMTIAEGIKEDSITISKQMSTKNAPGEGDGMQSFRQRVAGRGKGGLGMAQSSGAAKVVIPSFTQEPELDSDTDVDTTDLSPMADAMGKIAYNIIDRNKTGYADVVFVIDSSGSMQNNIQDVAGSLYDMTDVYDKSGLNYRLGIVQFNVKRDGENITIDPLTPDPGLLQKRIKALHITGDEHALDALMQALTYVKFRPESERNLVLVTDEFATTGWKSKGAIQELRAKVIREAKLLKVAVNVLGYNEPFQKELAERTGGLWLEIPGGQVGGPSTSAAATRKGTAPPIEVTQKMLRYFREFGRHISRTSGGGIGGAGGAKSHIAKVDIILMVDYSRSMAGKAEAIKGALETFFGTLDLFALDYRVGLIRFAEGKDKIAVIDGISVAQLPLQKNGIYRLLSYPYGGNEYLLDAVVEGLPKVRFRSKRRTVLIMTDEPSTGNKYGVDEALKVCQELGVQVNVLGPTPSGTTEKMLEKGKQLPGNDFQSIVVNQTGGIFRPMPSSLALADRNQ